MAKLASSGTLDASAGKNGRVLHPGIRDERNFPHEKWFDPSFPRLEWLYLPKDKGGPDV